MAHTLRARLLFLLLTSASLVSAQLPHVDITLVPGTNNDLEVRLRPDADFDGFLSGLVFTISWDAASSAHLGLTVATPENQYVTVNKSGSETDDSGIRYQIFAGFGTQVLSDIPTMWLAGTEYPICTIAVNGGPAAFSIVNSSWTAANNGDYFISLNGSDQTGIIYETSTGVSAGSSLLHDLSVEPNPAQESAIITAQVKAGTEVDLTLVNAAGQEVWKRTIASSTGTLREPLEMARLDRGVYMLRMNTPDGITTRRVVKR